MTTKNKKGFTIIEVVLVLAIAGLIFLMVFIALPALQRAQRNTQREDDLARVLTAVNQYQANNNGKVPFGYSGNKLANFVSRYIDQQCDATKWSNGTFSEGCSNEFKDPQGEIYKMEDKGSAKDFTYTNGEYDTTTSDVKNEKTFYGYSYATCGDEGMIVKGTGDRDVAVFMILEGGAIACNDNH